MSLLAIQKNLALGPGRFHAETDSYPQAVGADFPAYFSLGKRTRMNYLGTGRDVRTEAYLSIYSFGAGSPNDATALVKFPSEAHASAFVAFLGQLEAPPAPPQDPTLVAAGQAAFASAGCDGCHHVGHPELVGIVTYDRAATGLERLSGVDPAFPRGSPLMPVPKTTSNETIGTACSSVIRTRA